MEFLSLIESLNLGTRALNKNIPMEIINLPHDLLFSFLEGYMSGYSCHSDGIYRATSISKVLIQQLNLIIAKLYKVNSSFVECIKNPTTMIDGRVVNQNTTYETTFRKQIKKQSVAFVKDNIIWTPIREILRTDIIEEVYNIEVEEDNSYTANNAVVHNCQSFSFAGNRKGMATKDSIEIISLEQYLKLKAERFEFEGQSYLFWEYIRLLEEVKPKYFLLENVLMDKKWERIITNTLGVQPIMINSALLSAQNRKRLYWTNIPNVQQPLDKGLLLKDIIKDGDTDRDKSLTITTRVGGATKDRYLNKSMHQMIKVGNVNPSGSGMNSNVFHVDGKCHTLTTNKGEGVKITGGAQRGRYLVDGKRADNKVENLSGLTEQRLEIRDDGKSNCLTTVQKDSLLVYIHDIQVGINYKINKWNSISNIFTYSFNDIDMMPIYLMGTDTRYIKLDGKFEMDNRVYLPSAKSPTLDTKAGRAKVGTDKFNYRKLTPIECARLQTVPDLYCSIV